MDLDAIFDPPRVCTPEEVALRHTIPLNFQTSFVLALDAYIDIRVRYRQGLLANPQYRLLK
jgi:hypothetical protein